MPRKEKDLEGRAENQEGTRRDLVTGTKAKLLQGGGVIKGSGVCPGPKGGEAAILARSPHRGKGRREARLRGLEGWASNIQ